MQPVQRRALLLACASAAASSTNYTNHGPLLDLIARDFGLSAADVGLVATAFFGASLLVMLTAGTIADRYGPRRVVVLAFALVAVGNLGSGLAAPSFPMLLGWKALTGLGTGSTFVALSAYLNRMFAGGKGLFLAQGVFGASFLLGSGSVLVLMPPLAGAEGDWRRAFWLGGAGVAAMWLAWTLLSPPEPKRAPGPPPAFATAARERNVWILALCHMCGFGLSMVVGTWTTIYLVRAFGLPLTPAGALGSLVLVTGIVGRSLGGAILERGVPPVRLIRVALCITAAGLLVMAFPLGSLPLALLGLLLTGTGVGLPYAAVFIGAAAAAPSSPASAQALVGFVATLIAVVGPPLVGGLLDSTGSFAGGFSVLAGLALLVLLATRWLRPMRLRRV